MGRPVEATEPAELVDGRVGRHDVVATLGVVGVVAGLAEQYVVAWRDLARVVEVRCAVVTDQGVRTCTALDPVVAAVALGRVRPGAGGHEVGARSAEDRVAAGPAVDQVAAVAAEEQVEARAAVDGVVAGAALEGVGAVGVGDDVVAVTAEHDVVAAVAVDDVVARTAPEGVVVGSTGDPVHTRGAVVDGLSVEAAGVDGVGGAVGDRPVGLALQQQVLVALGGGVVGDVGTELREALGGAVEVGELEPAVDGREGVGLQGVGAVGVALDHLGERVALELREEVHARRSVEVVEPVAVLQVGELVLEDVVERRAEQATVEVRGLGQATHPQVHVLDPGVGLAVPGVPARRCRA